MNEAIEREKKRIALRQYIRYFALGEEAKEKTHVKLKKKERANSTESVKAAFKVKSKLKRLLKKARKNTFPLAFRNYEDDEFMDSVVVLHHYKGKTIDNVVAELPMSGQNKLDLYFQHPGRPLRHIASTEDLNYALKDFMKVRNSAVNIHLHEHLASAFAGLFSRDDSKILVGVNDIWEVAKFSSGYKLITKAALEQMANLIEHRHLKVQNSVLAAFWALAFNHRLPVKFLQEKVLPHLTNKKIRHKFFNHNTQDPEIYEFHVRTMGLLACMVCEGGGKIGHVLGDDGIDLLVDFSIAPSSPEAHRLGYMALFDAVLGHRGPSLHIVRSKHAVDLLMRSIEELISLEVVTEAFEIVCALSRVDGVPESHFHSLEAVGHIINVITVFDNEGTNVLGGITQDQWEFVMLCALGTLWGIASGDHCPRFTVNHVAEILRIAHKTEEEDDEHQEELEYVIFGILGCVAWRGGDGLALLTRKENLDFSMGFLYNDSLRIKENCACTISWVLKNSNTIDIYDAVFDTLVASLEHNKLTPSVAKHLIEAFISLANCKRLLPAEYIARFAKLVPCYEKEELEQYMCLVWTFATVKENKRTMAKDETLITNLLAVAKKYSMGKDYDIHLLYSIICTFWMIIGDNHDHNELCIQCGWVSFLSTYLHHSVHVDIDDRPSLLARLSADDETKNRMHNKARISLKRPKGKLESPRTRIHVKGDSMPHFKVPTLVSHENEAYDSRCDTWTICICCLWTLVDHDHATSIILREKIPTVLLALITEDSSRITPLLRIRASGFLLQMSLKNKKSRSEIISWGSTLFVDMVCTTLLYCSDNDTRCYAAMSITRRAKGAHRASLANVGAIHRLLILLDTAAPSTALAEYTSQALLNLSSLSSNQWIIPRALKGRGFRIVLRFATKDHDAIGGKLYPSQIYCAGILTNLIMHRKNRTMIYKVELKRRTDELYGPCQIKEDKNTNDVIISEKQKRKKKQMQDSDPRQKFLKWLSQEIEGSKGNPKVVETRLATSLPATHDRHSLNKLKLARPNSPKAMFDTPSKGRRRITFSGGSKSLRKVMCRRVSHVWEEKNPIGAKAYSTSLFHHADAPHIEAEAHGGSSLSLAKLDVVSPRSSPWEPSVASVNWEQAMSQKRNVSKTGKLGGKFKVVLDPPESPRNHIVFSPGGVSKNGKSSRLAAWPHLKGAKAGAGIFPSFTMPDGQVMYFYESDRIQEAHLPPEQKPKVPENDSHFGTPILPVSILPHYYCSSDPPRLRSMPPPVPPGPPHTGIDDILEHTAQEMVCFGFKKHTEVKLSMAGDKIDPNAWTLKKSVFAPREYYNDSGTFWDDAETEHVAFDLDWQRCCNKSVFRRFLANEYHIIHPFAIGDEVHGIVSETTGMWKIGIVQKIDASGHATVKFIDTGQLSPDLSILHLRFPGGEWGGQGGTNPRIDKDSKTIEVDHILQVGIIKSLRGLKNLELQRFEHFTHCKMICPSESELDDLDDEESQAVLKIRGKEELIETAEKYLSECIDLARIKRALVHHVEVAYNAFNYFKSIGTGNSATLQENEYLDFIHLCHINDENSKTCNLTRCRNVFQKVLMPSPHYDTRDDASAHHRVDKASKALRRFEWLEVIVRLADMKYRNEAHSVAECVEFLFRRNIEKHLMSEASRSSNYFRDERLYFEEIDKIFRLRLSNIIKLFCAYSGKGSTGKNEFYMTPNEFVECMREAQMINHTFTMRQAQFSASWSMQLIIDDVKFPVRAGGMTFVDFLECLCRASELFDFPSKEELAESKCSDIAEYYEHTLRRETKNIHKQTSKNLTRLEMVKNMLNHTNHKHMVNGVHLDGDSDMSSAERLSSFLDLLLCRTKKFSKRLNGDGVAWKTRHLLGQYKHHKFHSTRDRRFKINRSHKHKEAIFRPSGKVVKPQPITFGERKEHE